MRITVFSEAEQGVGFFDNGKFREQKPIAFPHERGAVSGIGTLFYWAWGKSNEESVIAMHPHQAFEIVSYMIDGYGEHRDSLGSRERMEAGGAQFMRAGSGIMHEERIFGEGFQIWFEPNLRETIKQEPSYRSFTDEDFPVAEGSGWRVKTVIGSGSPIDLTADARFYDAVVNVGGELVVVVEAGRSVAALAIRGTGALTVAGGMRTNVAHKDFIVLQNDGHESESLRLGADSELRLTYIDVPTVAAYPLYRNS